MIRTVKGMRYITPLREGGSLPAIIEAASLAGFGIAKPVQVGICQQQPDVRGSYNPRM